MPLIHTTEHNHIHELNDAFRRSFDSNLGRAVLTAGVSYLPSDVSAIAVRKTTATNSGIDRGKPCVVVSVASCYAVFDGTFPISVWRITEHLSAAAREVECNRAHAHRLFSARNSRHLEKEAIR